MRITDHLKRLNRPPISFEIIPPQRGESIDSLMGMVSELVDYCPPFIDVTSHAAQLVHFDEAGMLCKEDAATRSKPKRKRPGTLAICLLIQERYKIDAVPHVCCKGFTREETEDFLIDLNYARIQNVFAVRGDDLKFEKIVPEGRSVNTYAVDLVRQIQEMNQGRFLDNLVGKPTGFHIGVAGYPEKHVEASNMDADLGFLKEKVDAGADYVVTQMFFDNACYFDFVHRCKEAGITVPIIPGLRVLSKKYHLKSLPRDFHVVIPDKLVQEVSEASKHDVMRVGASWTSRQIGGLIEKGVPGIHLYVVRDVEPVHEVMKYIVGD